MLADLEGRRFISLKDWRQLLGELRSMLVTIPGAEGLFSHLQAALVASKRGRVRVTKSARDELCDWGWLAADISARPTYIAEVVRPKEATARIADYMGGFDPVTNELSSDESAYEIVWWIASDSPEFEQWKPE